MKKILLFGGTFNPVHNGHVFMIRECIKSINPFKIYVIPTNISPHKLDRKDVVSEMHRFNMCKLAFRDFENVEVSDYEIRKQGISYTVDTIIHFKNAFDNHKIFLLMGSDMFLTIKSWKEYEKILDLVSLVVIPRNLDTLADIENFKNSITNKSEDIIILNTNAPDISSTDVREKIISDQNINQLIPCEVADYIEHNCLYNNI